MTMAKSKSTRARSDLSRAHPAPDDSGAPGFTPDALAQAQWTRVAEVSNRISGIIDDIAWRTVGGGETRSELTQAGDLLEQVTAILERTSAREAVRFDELERLYPKEVWEAQP
jgi:hypothetical protein